MLQQPMAPPDEKDEQGAKVRSWGPRVFGSGHTHTSSLAVVSWSREGLLFKLL